MYLVLFANCIPVKGAKRSIICDIQRNDFKFIPNDMYDFINDHLHRPLNELKAIFNEEDLAVVNDYINYITENEFGFITDEPHLFPKLDMTYRGPELVNNAILDRDSESTYSIKDALEQLKKLGCSFVQIRIFNDVDVEEIRDICELFEDSSIRSFELILKYTTQYSAIENIIKLVNRYQRLTTMIVHSAHENAIKYDGIGNLGKIVFTKQAIINETHCGYISPLYFVINTQMFTEAQRFNTCLNKKISIDSKGDIRNCPALKQKFGNAANTSLKQVVDNESFRDVWNISKDSIEVCKDCEFRYICTDCRAFVPENDLKYNKPAKCTYDPYTGIWE